jgi:hypothetical protein
MNVPQTIDRDDLDLFRKEWRLAGGDSATNKRKTKLVLWNGTFSIPYEIKDGCFRPILAFGKEELFGVSLVPDVVLKTVLDYYRGIEETSCEVHWADPLRKPSTALRWPSTFEKYDWVQVCVQKRVVVTFHRFGKGQWLPAL